MPKFDLHLLVSFHGLIGMQLQKIQVQFQWQTRLDLDISKFEEVAIVFYSRFHERKNTKLFSNVIIEQLK